VSKLSSHVCAHHQAGIYHRFVVDSTSPQFHVIRLFCGDPVWTPWSRVKSETEERVARKKYVETVSFPKRVCRSASERLCSDWLVRECAMRLFTVNVSTSTQNKQTNSCKRAPHSPAKRRAILSEMFTELFSVSALLAALGVEVYLRSRDVDRTRAVDASLYLIDNDLYNHIDWWNDSTMGALRALTPARVEYFSSVIEQHVGASESRGQTLLDIGCGAGFVAMMLAEKGYKVVGVDMSLKSLQQARVKADSVTWNDTQTKPRFVHNDAAHLQMPPQTVDVVIMADVLEHIGDLNKTMIEVNRVLRPGGLFLFDTINRTRRSWLLAIVVLQYLGIGGIMPPNTHDWSLFIRPVRCVLICL
jgi:2-polyprenyl-6-hydroxyphenyl methylase/3-demethylubiquinone-9 3-methyltransferase